MKECDLDSVHYQLCSLHKAIGHLQRLTELRERRGFDCTPIRESVAALREHATALSAFSKLTTCPDPTPKSKLMALIWQLPLLPWSGTVL